MKQEISNLPAGDERILKITEWVLIISLLTIITYQLFTFNDSLLMPDDSNKDKTSAPVKQVKSN